jgi:RHH-type rel operon transcriptional repressor/antitoxin RelB
MSRQTAIVLSDEAFGRLTALAAKAGRTTESYIEEAIAEHLEDQDDFESAEKALESRKRGEIRTYSLDEVGRELGLDD